MYIINTKLITIIIVCLFCSCVSNKDILIQDVVGTYVDKKGKVTLDLKDEGSFLLKDDNKSQFCLGKWKLEKQTIVLNCEKPKNITDYISSYSIVVDSTFNGKINQRGSILIRNISLSKID